MPGTRKIAVATQGKVQDAVVIKIAINGVVKLVKKVAVAQGSVVRQCWPKT